MSSPLPTSSSPLPLSSSSSSPVLTLLPPQPDRFPASNPDAGSGYLRIGTDDEGCGGETRSAEKEKEKEEEEEGEKEGGEEGDGEEDFWPAEVTIQSRVSFSNEVQVSERRQRKYRSYYRYSYFHIHILAYIL